jgi:tetratricopeptide (TPR) repeat protein
MDHLLQKYTPTVAAALLFFLLALLPSPGFSQTEALDDLFVELQDPEDGNWLVVEKRIWKEWSKSGSPAMDLLLERGRRAMKAGDYSKAIEHLSALIDHAPDFAEAWNARATAFFMDDEYGLSVSDIEVALALIQRPFGAVSGLGVIYERLEQYDGALRAYQAALAVHPHRPDLIEAIERLLDKTEGTSL